MFDSCLVQEGLVAFPHHYRNSHFLMALAFPVLVLQQKQQHFSSMSPSFF